MELMRPELPSGTVTFLFTDVEGSTKLLQSLGAEAYAGALAEHRRVIREACARFDGVEVDTQGDAFFVAFPTAPGALAAAAEALAGLEPGPIRVRVGIHTGTPHVGEEGYVGTDVHRAARIAACGHGGQVLVSASTAALLSASGSEPRALPLVDLGEHRLKDLSAPERIFQLGVDEFPPLHTLHQTNLPVPSTPFLGRAKELTEVLGLLWRDHLRLLTLTGPGGTGKTRLAAQVAALSSERYPHGVWWVPLAPLRDVELVLETAGQALGAKNGLAEHIGDKELLLLFDNFEHVVEAAVDLADLLSACPNLDLLVTSREPLHVTGEQEYPVPPLVHEEGVGFFLARARSVDPAFQADDAVSEICRRLDDLPLALELAAARVKALSSQQILERLEQRLPLLTGGARDMPERQRTLRATIEWSYDLLELEEQRLFARLAVFSGGCTLEAAEQVAEADLDTLQSLVDKSLLRRTGDRFWMLETIREFATERLEAAAEADELLKRHAAHFQALAEEAEPHVHRDSLEWVNRLEEDHDNIRAALDWLEASGQADRVLRVAGSLWRFWYLKSHLTEGRRRLDGVLNVDGPPTAEWAKALTGAAVMALNLGDTAAAGLRAEQALATYRAIGDGWGTAYATMMIGYAAAEAGDVDGGQPHAAESVRLFEALGDRHYALIASTGLAWMTGEVGDEQEEERLHLENLERARELGNEGVQAEALAQLAYFHRGRGELAEAKAKLQEAITIDHRRGNPLSVAVNLARLAAVLCRAGDASTAARLLSSSDALTKQLGAEVPWWAVRRNVETMTILRTTLDEAALDEELEAGKRLGTDEAVALALDA